MYRILGLLLVSITLVTALGVILLTIARSAARLLRTRMGILPTVATGRRTTVAALVLLAMATALTSGAGSSPV